MKDAPLSYLSRQANINTKNHLMAFSDSSWKDCPDNGISTGEYVLFYQVGSIDHGTHVPWPVYQLSEESEYNSSCTLGMALAHLRMLIYELLKKDPDIVPDEEPIIILYTKYYVCMAKNSKGTKRTRHISRRVHLWKMVRNNGPVVFVFLSVFRHFFNVFV